MTVTATNTANPNQTASTTLTLWPGLLSKVVAASPSPYSAGSSETFIATVTDMSGAPMANINVGFQANGVNVQSASALTNGAGLATFTYTGTAVGWI